VRRILRGQRSDVFRTRESSLEPYLPWLDAQKTCQLLNSYGLPGVKFQPIIYKPFNAQYKVAGAQIHFTEPRRAPLMAINFYALEVVKRLAGRDLLSEAVKSGKGLAMFDKINGTESTGKAMQKGASAKSIVSSWKAGEDAFRQKRAQYLLY